MKCNRQARSRITAMLLALLLMHSAGTFPVLAQGAAEVPQSVAQEATGSPDRNGQREDMERSQPSLTLGASGVTFTITENEDGPTNLYLPAGEPVTDEALLEGVSAEDENGEAVPVTVAEVDSLDRDDPQPQLEGGLPVPYSITYEAKHPETQETVTAQRKAYVTSGIMAVSGSPITTYDALAAAVSTNGTDATVTLGGDISGTDELVVERDLTLDLNGYTLDIEVSTGNGVNLDSGVTLTIVDSAGGGVLNATSNQSGNAFNAGAGINTTDATLIIQNSTVNANGGNNGAGIGGGFNGSGGTVIISGDAQVEAYTRWGSNDIGSGNNRSGGTLTIENGAKVTLASKGTDAVLSIGECVIDGMGARNSGIDGTYFWLTVTGATAKPAGGAWEDYPWQQQDGKQIVREGAVIELNPGGQVSGWITAPSDLVITQQTDGTYTFTMPGEAVTIEPVSLSTADIIHLDDSDAGLLAAAEASGGMWAYNGSDQITVNGGAEITITGSTSSRYVEVYGNANITLDSASIDMSALYGKSALAVTSDMSSTAMLTLTLMGESNLIGGYNGAGLAVLRPDMGIMESKLVITAASDGILHALGGDNGAGIGGTGSSNLQSAGEIVIVGGTVNATGGMSGAGIGGGLNGAGGSVAISGNAKVTATSSVGGSRYGVGSGGGSTTSGGSLTIQDGARVTLTTYGTNADLSIGECVIAGIGAENMSPAIDGTYSWLTLTGATAYPEGSGAWDGAWQRETGPDRQIVRSGTVVDLTPSGGGQFLGWSVTPSTLSIIQQSDGTHTFTMPVEAVSVAANFAFYPITYHANGGSGTAPAESGKTEGETFQAAANTFTAPSGYRFKEWNTAADGSGDPYAAGATITMPGKALDLYAIWEPIPATAYTVTFNANGGTVSPEYLWTGVDGKLAYLPIPTHSGSYTFDGWFTAASGGSEVTTSTVFTTDTKVFAQWTDNSTSPAIHTVTFNPVGGAVSPTTMQTGADGKLSYLPTPAREGYTFEGWFTAASGGTQITASHIFTADATIHAHWKKKDDPNGGDNGNSGGSTGTGSGARSSGGSGGGSSTPDSRTAKTTIPASAFSWDGRTLTIDHDYITPLGLVSVRWDGVEVKEYSIHKGSVIVRFAQDFIDCQAPGEHTVRVEFLNHTGELTVDVGTKAGTENAGIIEDGDTQNPSTGGDDLHNPQTGDFGASPWRWLLALIPAAVLAFSSSALLWRRVSSGT